MGEMDRLIGGERTHENRFLFDDQERRVDFMLAYEGKHCKKDWVQKPRDWFIQALSKCKLEMEHVPVVGGISTNLSIQIIKGQRSIHF